MILDGPDAQGDLLLLKLTGQSRYAGSLMITPADVVMGPLLKTGYLRLDRMLSTHLSQVRVQPGRLTAEALASVHKALAARHARSFSGLKHGAQLPAAGEAAGRRPFHPGATTVPYAGRVFDADEVEAAVAATLDFWLTLGPEGDAFEGELARFLGVRRSILVNSGSSANLVAFAALTSAKLGDRRLRPGDEVITVAAGFPTTVAPILQHGAVPVFVDNDPLTLNARVDQLEAARSPRTRAVMMAHTLGNPFDLAAVTAFCERHGLWLVEDNCDALGSTY
ncbi:MAG TPA: DegT/DnrJ/EryC1/StrS family aminotransferase, partial [Verrucomicrobiota bacterium]|nr:DegT/DnrJ/EryC1/StrS family aminotransferase [Verrucomicrobiota bacterium]